MPKTPFQIFMLIGFLVLAIRGLLLFASKGIFKGNVSDVGTVVIWGTANEAFFDGVIARIKEGDEGYAAVTYVEKDPRTLTDEFTSALAAGRGPDLILLPSDSIVENFERIQILPFSYYPERTFKDTFIEQGELYLLSGGVAGIPFSVDPMVMYWNRSILTRAKVAEPPKNWEEFYALAPKITERDVTQRILKSFVSLGEYRNILHAKEILSMLILQSGNSIMGFNESGALVPVIMDSMNYSMSPVEAALRFYTEFANQNKSVYSWSRAMPEARKLFTAGNLAIYFGFASEIQGIREENPNLNFDVSVVPQTSTSALDATFANMLAFSIPRASLNPNGALTVAERLTEADVIGEYANTTLLPPVRRDLLATSPTDDVAKVFRDSALISRGWLDPNPRATEQIFSGMIEGVTSGREQPGQAVETANQQMMGI